ncbi:MAG: hypothetical protein ABL916_20935 [Burkholderiaceae bacterium]
MVDPVQGISRRRALVASACVIGAGPGSISAGALAAEPAAPRPQPAVPIRVLEDLGVELMVVRLAASDFLIDLRYRVKDVAKAQPLLERKVQAVLVNEATGDRYYIPQAPKVGSLKQSATAKQPAIVDRVYFMLFANPDRKLKSGERVTLYAGDSVVRDIVVEG